MLVRASHSSGIRFDVAGSSNGSTHVVVGQRSAGCSIERGDVAHGRNCNLRPCAKCDEVTESCSTGLVDHASLEQAVLLAVPLLP
jgi:hypothetical protein